VNVRYACVLLVRYAAAGIAIDPIVDLVV